MGTYRKRFNEKARSGAIAKQEKLRKARQKQFTRHLDDGTNPPPPVEDDQDNNTNSELFQPMTAEEKAERKRKLEEQLRPDPESKVSKQKRKRFEKYVEHQLKREEKQVLIEKLQESKFDTSLLKPSKLLGQGKMTKKEEFAEALSLEKQGRGDEHTKEVLYEEREVRDWDEDVKDQLAPATSEPYANYSDGFDDDEDEGSGDDGDQQPKSTFVDLRPTSLGGSGFGFANVPKVKKVSKKSYTWRTRIAAEEKRKNKIEDDLDFESSSGDDEDDEDDEDQEEDEELAEEENEIEEDEEEEDDDVEQEKDEEEESSEEQSSEDGESEEIEEEEEEAARSKFQHSLTAESFKQWADDQIRKLEGRESIATSIALPNIDYKPQIHKEDLDDGLVDESAPIDETSQRKAHFVTVTRDPDIQEARMDLPVFGEEHRIMEAIHHNDVIILCGETGSGKTTQVPQFLYESGYGSADSEDTPGMIGVTQPRRVAAVSMAERVGAELGDHGVKVGYQIRFDSSVGNDTRLKFMTDGVLLREMMTDFIMLKYSSIIIDEAHERNINTDILIGMLSRVVKLRAHLHSQDPKKYKKLKLIIMSATLRVSDFTSNPTLFDIPPPILKVEARQYPVSIHFNKTTPFNYIDEAFRKAVKIHKKLPKGGILIFMTGQNEITGLVKKLKKEFPFPERTTKGSKRITKKQELEQEREIPNVKINSKQADFEAEEIDFSVKVQNDEQLQDDAEDAINSDPEEEGFEEELEEDQTANDPLYVLPLYSLLPTSEQMKVFKAPPAGSRLCIVATNVAETSLTIPGIRYVIDCGRSKERKYDEETGVQSFEIDWVSKASAGQRAGRAGRTGPGHCYRLYSSAVYERDFLTFSKPEILRMPIESVVLNMKSMGIDNVINFPFPTPPDRSALNKAEKLLRCLGALDGENRITELGKNIALFPLAPRFAKILILADQGGCLGYVVAIVSALSVGDPFINENELGLTEVRQIKPKTKSDNGDSDIEIEEVEEIDPMEVERKRKLQTKFNTSRQMFGKLDKYSDALRLLSAVCAYDHVSSDKRTQFVSSHFLRGKLMDEISKLRKQITYIVKSITSKENIASNVTDSELKLALPTTKQVKLVKQMITAGFLDQISIRSDLIDPDVKITNNANVINIAYTPVIPITTQDQQLPYVYIHPSSILCNAGEIPPSYLVYQSINLSSNSDPLSTQLPKARMRLLTEITPTPLTNIAKNSGLLTYSKPLGPPYAPRLLDTAGTRRECYVVPRFGANVGTGGVGWDLKPIKVTQKRVNGTWVNE